MKTIIFEILDLCDQINQMDDFVVNFNYSGFVHLIDVDIGTTLDIPKDEYDKCYRAGSYMEEECKNRPSFDEIKADLQNILTRHSPGLDTFIKENQ